MANNWQSLDANFPTFEEHESPYEQIKKLVDYMRQLTDQLRFSLNNLGTDNWNSSNLEQFSAALTGDIEQDLKTCLEAVNRLQNTVSSISARVAALSTQVEKITALEQAVSDLSEAAQENADALQKQAAAIEKLEQAKTDAENKIKTLQDAVSAISLHVVPNGDTLTIGYEGGTVKLQGDVYINDVLQEA